MHERGDTFGKCYKHLARTPTLLTVRNLSDLSAVAQHNLSVCSGAPFVPSDRLREKALNWYPTALRGVRMVRQAALPKTIPLRAVHFDPLLVSSLHLGIDAPGLGALLLFLRTRCCVSDGGIPRAL